jgi:undecaprenyl-diphosphatase
MALAWRRHGQESLARLRGGDVSLTRALNGWGGARWPRRVFGIVSRLGDGVAWYALILALPLVDGLRGLAAGVHLAVTALVALVMYTALKRLTRRPRPFRSGAAIVAYVPPMDEYSFPSGHTLHAVSLSLVACSHYPVLVLVLAPFALLVAASRVVLGLHYPSDVLAATVIGGALGEVSCRVGRGLLPVF